MSSRRRNVRCRKRSVIPNHPLVGDRKIIRHQILKTATKPASHIFRWNMMSSLQNTLLNTFDRITLASLRSARYVLPLSVLSRAKLSCFAIQALTSLSRILPPLSATCVGARVKALSQFHPHSENELAQHVSGEIPWRRLFCPRRCSLR